MASVTNSSNVSTPWISGRLVRQDDSLDILEFVPISTCYIILNKNNNWLRAIFDNLDLFHTVPFKFF